MPSIIDRGRGPEIEGTRITVYDIMDYYKQDWHHTQIANWLDLSSEEVLTAIRYIEEHKEEVLANYQKILDRCARGNPPEIQAKVNASLGRARALRDALRAQQSRNGDNHEGSSGGH
jgi:uncharacterized protein (DUF433 family)